MKKNEHFTKILIFLFFVYIKNIFLLLKSQGDLSKIRWGGSPNPRINPALLLMKDFCPSQAFKKATIHRNTGVCNRQKLTLINKHSTVRFFSPENGFGGLCFVK